MITELKQYKNCVTSLDITLEVEPPSLDEYLESRHHVSAAFPHGHLL